MTDSVQVFPPGFRITDSETGSPISGGTVEFYDAGTTTPKTVHADKDLSTTIGTTVDLDAQGYPTSDGSTKSLIYVGTSAYKIVIKDGDGATVATHDNIPGAVAVVDPGDTTVVATRPVETKSLSYTVLTADQSKVFAGNCSGGDVTFTLPSAVTVGSGWFVTIQHAGSANQVLIATVSSQTIAGGVTSFASTLPLSFSGEEVTLVSDGGNWRAVGHTSPNIKRGSVVLTVADRLSSPPGSPVEGALYLLISTPSGAWSSFATGDIAQYTNSAWVRFTPPTDCGWIAYVQDENSNYQFRDSAWTLVAPASSDSTAGMTAFASQAEMEAATDTTKAVIPARVKYHPGVAKAWLMLDLSAGSANVIASHNITSVTYVGTGKFTVTFDVDFSSTNYIAMGSARDSTTGANAPVVTMDSTQVKTTGTMGLKVVQAAIGFLNSSEVAIAFFGDQ